MAILRRRAVNSLLAGAALALLVAGCGGSGDASTGSADVSIGSVEATREAPASDVGKDGAARDDGRDPGSASAGKSDPPPSPKSAKRRESGDKTSGPPESGSGDSAGSDSASAAARDAGDKTAEGTPEKLTGSAKKAAQAAGSKPQKSPQPGNLTGSDAEAAEAAEARE